MNIDKLIKKYGIISDQVTAQELRIILEECQAAVCYLGSVVEFGCYAGTTSLFIQRVIEESPLNHEYHVYDSFEGLPEKSKLDTSVLGEQFETGELRVSKKTFVQHFKKAGLSMPFIHKGWFSELIHQDIPNTVCFAFLDGDYYESIKIPLNLLVDKLVHNAVIIVDDYDNPSLPGAKLAVDEWVTEHNKLIKQIHSLAVIYW